MVNCKFMLFDLDGTLIDSAPSILNALANSFKAKGLQPVAALTNELIGPPLREIVAQLVSAQHADMIDEIVAEFKCQYDDTYCLQAPLYPGVREALGLLIERGVSLYVVTNKRALPTEKILKASGLFDIFDGVYSPDSLLPAAVNKSELLQHLIKMNQIDTRKAVYVGDKEEDCLAAHVNNLEFFHAKWGYGDVSYQHRNALNKAQDIAEFY